MAIDVRIKIEKRNQSSIQKWKTNQINSIDRIRFTWTPHVAPYTNERMPYVYRQFETLPSGIDIHCQRPRHDDGYNARRISRRSVPDPIFRLCSRLILIYAWQKYQFERNRLLIRGSFIPVYDAGSQPRFKPIVCINCFANVFSLIIFMWGKRNGVRLWNQTERTPTAYSIYLQYFLFVLWSKWFLLLLTRCRRSYALDVGSVENTSSSNFGCRWCGMWWW